MDRRRFLACAACSVVAGCGGASDGDSSRPMTSNDVASSGTDANAGSTETRTALDVQTRGRHRRQPTTVTGKPEIDIQNGDLTFHEKPTVSVAEVAPTVTNVGSGTSGMVTVSVDWLDGDGTRIGRSTKDLFWFEPGETWVPFLRWIVGSEDVENFDVSAEIEYGQPAAPPGMELSRSRLRVGDDQFSVGGRIENDSDESVGNTAALVRIIDARDRIVTNKSTNLGAFGAGDSREFVLRWLASMIPVEVKRHDVAITVYDY